MSHVNFPQARVEHLLPQGQENLDMGCFKSFAYAAGLLALSICTSLFI